MEMLKSKTIDRIVCIAIIVMLVLTAVVWTGKSSAGKQSTITVGYEGLFDQSFVHTIDIEIDDWDGLIASASQETYVECNVTIDGEKVTNVGIRGKGNTSLSSVSTMDSEKYSFKIEFNQYVKGKTYRGLDKLSLNNLIYDATMMKDYLAYTLMAKMDVPSPLCSFAQITVNGEPWGLYLAVEGVEDGFMERNNMTTGELYKPDSMSFGGGRGNGRDFDFENFRVKEDEDAEETGTESSSSDQQTGFSNPFGNPPDGQMPQGGFSGQMPGGFSMPEGMTPPEGFSMPEGMNFSGDFQMPEGMDVPESGEASDGEEGDGSGRKFRGEGFFSFGGGMFNFGMGSSDTKLQYIDDDPDSYSNIFNNAKTDIGKKDKARLIEALKTLNSENAQDAVFTDEVIRYLAVHDFLQNSDSYTGMMVHNYYLYEEDGKLAIIPWDYNLAFGGMGGGSDASGTVNSPIDSPVNNGNASDRPLVSWILNDEEALAQYHEIYSQFVSEVIESGWLESEIARVSEMIRPYVEADANSFYTVEEFDTAIETLQSYCALRGESIRGQLEGTIPSTSEGQRKDSSALVDASSLDLSVMGTMNTGGGGPGGNGGPSMPGGSGMPSMPGSGGMPQMPGGDSMPSGFSGTGMPSMPGGSGMPSTSGESGMPAMPGGSSGAPSGFTKSEGDNSDSQAPENPVGTESSSEEAKPGSEDGKSSGQRQMPAGFTPPDMDRTGGRTQTDWVAFGICVALLLAAIVITCRIKGHNG